MLGNIPAAAAFASEFPTKYMAASFQPSSSGMIQFGNVSFNGGVVDLPLGRRIIPFTCETAKKNSFSLNSPLTLFRQINDLEETVTFRAVSADEEGQKQVEKAEVSTHNPDTLKHIEKKMKDKGLHRLDRHPRDGIPLDKQSKGGRGGKYTWDGPGGIVSDELDPAPAEVDMNDPNYVSEEEEERAARETEGVVIGEVEVTKVADQGVARVDVDPHLKLA